MDFPTYSCVLCTADIEESAQHLFLQCPFAQQCWNSLHLQISDSDGPFRYLESLKLQLHVLFFSWKL